MEGDVICYFTPEITLVMSLVVTLLYVSEFIRLCLPVSILEGYCADCTFYCEIRFMTQFINVKLKTNLLPMWIVGLKARESDNTMQTIGITMRNSEIYITISHCKLLPLHCGVAPFIPRTNKRYYWRDGTWTYTSINNHLCQHHMK